MSMNCIKHVIPQIIITSVLKINKFYSDRVWSGLNIKVKIVFVKNIVRPLTE